MPQYSHFDLSLSNTYNYNCHALLHLTYNFKFQSIGAGEFSIPSIDVLWPTNVLMLLMPYLSRV
jgi:hypothetical protein